MIPLVIGCLDEMTLLSLAINSVLSMAYGYTHYSFKTAIKDRRLYMIKTFSNNNDDFNLFNFNKTTIVKKFS